MMTANEMAPAVGQTVLVRMERWVLPCLVRDVRNVWGKPQLLVVPVSGSGEGWIDLGRLVRDVAPAGKGLQVA